MDVGEVKLNTGKIEVLGDIREDGTEICLLFVDCDYGDSTADMIDLPGLWGGKVTVTDMVVRAIAELDREEVERLIPMLEAAVKPVAER
jgi:hypothetical protein